MKEEYVSISEKAIKGLLINAIETLAEYVVFLPDGDKKDLQCHLCLLCEGDKEGALEAIRELLEDKPIVVKEMEFKREPLDRELLKHVEYIAERVRSYRYQMGQQIISQEYLAEESDVPLYYIQGIENLTISPSNMALEKIAAVLGTTVAGLLPPGTSNG